MDYELIRSERKTLSLQVREDGSLLVRAPLRMQKRQVEAFIREKSSWIASCRRRLEEQKKRAGEQQILKDPELRELREAAKKLFPELVAKYAEHLGLPYGKITVRFQRSRWGSCSREGNLSFNGLLLLAPEEVLESVVAHELCHLRYKDHGKDFYALLYSIFPAYPQCKKWLKENGSLLVSRLPK